MSDDLVKRWDEYIESMGCVMGEVEHMAQQMRDRIEELDAKVRTAEEIGRAFEEDAGQLRAKLTWQPIETAPKDGTTVLTYPNYIVTHYETEEAYPCPGWAVSWDDCMDAYITMRTPPTHWMELPEEPK